MIIDDGPHHISASAFRRMLKFIATATPWPRGAVPRRRPAMLGEAVNAGGGGEDMGSPPANCGNAARGPGVSALADAPGDCWPHCILSGGLRFHEERGKA